MGKKQKRQKKKDREVVVSKNYLENLLNQADMLGAIFELHGGSREACVKESMFDEFEELTSVSLDDSEKDLQALVDSEIEARMPKIRAAVEKELRAAGWTKPRGVKAAKPVDKSQNGTTSHASPAP